MDLNALLKRWMPKDFLEIECDYNEQIYYPCNCKNHIYQPSENSLEKNFSSLEL